MAHSWPVRLAAALLGLYVLVGVALIALSIGLLLLEDGMGLGAGAVAIAGVFVCTTAVIHRSRLLQAAPGARLQAALLGVVLIMWGLIAMVAAPAVGAVLAAPGVALAGLMMTPAAAAELGGWTSGGWSG
jgi:hypothetical protein